MSKNNPTNGERMTAIEVKIDSLECSNKEQSKLLSKIDAKLDSVIKDKADKEEVNTLRNKVNNITYKMITSLIILLIGVVGFLLQQTLFK